MIIQALNYLFYRIQKVCSINFGQDAGIDSTSFWVSGLLTSNVISLVIFFNKILFHDIKISIGFFAIVFIISLILCYFLFLYKAKYKQIILYYETKSGKDMKGTLCVIGYIFFSFLLFVIVAAIKV